VDFNGETFVFIIRLSKCI